MSLFSEVRMVTLGVSAVDSAVRFYTAALEYRCVERGRVDPALAAVWGHDPDLALDYAIMAADDSGRCALRLVAGPQAGEPLWRLDNRLSATGAYALNFRCRDIHRQLERIRAAGGEAGAQPHFWEVNEQVHVYDSMSSDPDGIRLDLFSYTRGGELRGPLETEVSVVQTVALAVADVERSRAFYKALGFVELFDRVLDFEGLSEMLDMDRPVRIHNVNLIKDGHIVPGRVEMFAFLDTGLPAPQPMTRRAVAPNLGLLSFSLRVSDLDAALDEIESFGATTRTRLEAAVELPGFGQAQVASVIGPDGERIELVGVAGAGVEFGTDRD